MATLFIADLHLCVEEPAITAGFLRFLAGEARKADALYILGDLFEAWIGDDDPNPLHRKMAAAIKAGYQAFRAKVHKPWLQTLFLALPLFVRKRIAARMRANSKEANSSKSLAIMDVNQNAVVSAMEKHQVQWLIHGHTHRPAVHELIANQQPAFRVVLGAWHTEGSMVKVTADDVELIHFPF